MKKILTLGLVLIAFSATPAIAKKNSENDAKKVSHPADTDGNGTVSKAEFLKKHEDRFNKIDTNGNGELSAEELQTNRPKAKKESKEEKKAREARQAERKAKREAAKK